MTRTWLLMFVVAGCSAESVATVAQPAIALNAIALNAITTNAIATNAKTTEAIVSRALGTNHLYILGGGITADVTSVLVRPLEDPNARIFMRYLVECALSPDQALTWTNHNATISATYTGQFGLCPAWHSGPPDLACRERVSACILARNNAFGVTVEFSLRGTTPSGPIPLGTKVPIRENVPLSSQLVPSLRRCFRAPNGELRNCGWQRGSIGYCEPETRVSIAMGNSAECAGIDWLGVPGSGDEVLRVCAGTNACDHAAAIASVDNACGTTAPAIDFKCPAGGLYAVMTGSYNSYGRPDGEVGSSMLENSRCAESVCEARSECCGGWDGTCYALAETTCRYPANESQVFRWREGSFYGDLFGAKNLNPAKPQIQVNANYEVQSFKEGSWVSDGGLHSTTFVGVAFQQMYACASSNWTAPQAYVAQRVCAGPDPYRPNDPVYKRNCAAKYAGLCEDLCETLDTPPVRDYDAANCSDGQRAWARPMTTLLASPKDAVPDPGPNGTYHSWPILGW